jgi:hypothetical protein
MKIFSKRQMCALVLAIFFTFLLMFRVYAASAANWYSNFAGVTTAIAEKDVSLTGTEQFNCVSRSYTNYPSVKITHVGYNTFSCTVWKNNVHAGGWTRTGKVNWNSSYQVDSGIVRVYPTQGQSRKVTAAGSHDFGHFNGQSYDWDPNLSATGNYP